MDSEIRVRFAPSPTGPLHIGGVRTALYNYLFAKKNGGKFILRIEDTDQTRFVKNAENYIVETFKWLGIEFDEGVHLGGNYGPYRQSDRKSIYKGYAQQLIDNGWAYYAFDTPDDLEKIRKEYEAQKKNFQYDCNTRGFMRNSLTIGEAETQKMLEEKPYVIRFKFPKDTEIQINDLIRGEVKMSSNLLDDKVLFKSDGMPTYHLANIVDDHLMKISHVIRGEEWLPSAPLHVMLYKAFDWEASMPKFAHLPLLLKPDGNGKLSKRDGDRLGFPVFPLQWIDETSMNTSSGYREEGYLPEAVINILALLGWNPGIEQDIFSLEELVQLFSIDRISKSGAKFDLEKAKWINHKYIQTKTAQELALLFRENLKQKNINTSDEYVESVITLVKDRIYYLKDFWEQSYFFFEDPSTFDETIIKKKWKADTAAHLMAIAKIIDSCISFEKESLHNSVIDYIKSNELNMGQIMNCLRLAIVGASKGPDLFDIITLVGRETIVKRIEFATKRIQYLISPDCIQ